MGGIGNHLLMVAADEELARHDRTMPSSSGSGGAGYGEPNPSPKGSHSDPIVPLPISGVKRVDSSSAGERAEASHDLSKLGDDFEKPLHSPTRII